MNLVPKITLDTNCIINLADPNSQTPTSKDALSELVRAGLSGKIDIAITTRVEADLENDVDLTRKKEMMHKIMLFPVIGTIARLDITKLDHGDFLGGPETTKLFDELQKIIFPGLSKTGNSYLNKINDIDHLVGHIINRRDVFITDDGGILRKKDILKISPGIIVMSPAECLLFITSRSSFGGDSKMLTEQETKTLVEADIQNDVINWTEGEGEELLNYLENICRKGFLKKDHLSPSGNFINFVLTENGRDLYRQELLEAKDHIVHEIKKAKTIFPEKIAQSCKATLEDVAKVIDVLQNEGSIKPVKSDNSGTLFWLNND